MNYKEKLEHDYLLQKSYHDGIYTVEEYLSEYIFNYTTYDSTIDEQIVFRSCVIIDAILRGTTVKLIDDEADWYLWYIIIVNMPFFVDKIEWGTSFRGAWFQFHRGTAFDGVFENAVFDTEDLKNCMKAIVDFYTEQKELGN